jgi:hypothetical protein
VIVGAIAAATNAGVEATIGAMTAAGAGAAGGRASAEEVAGARATAGTEAKVLAMPAPLVEGISAEVSVLREPTDGPIDVWLESELGTEVHPSPSSVLLSEEGAMAIPLLGWLSSRASFALMAA